MDLHKKIGEILVGLKVLSPMDVERILQATRRSGQRSKFGRMGRKMGLLREEHILAALAVQLRMVPKGETMSLVRLLDHLQKVH